MGTLSYPSEYHSFLLSLLFSAFSDVTLCGGQELREAVGPSPPLQVGINELAVVLTKAKRVTYTVEGVCKYQRSQALAKFQLYSNGNINMSLLF